MLDCTYGKEKTKPQERQEIHPDKGFVPNKGVSRKTVIPEEIPTGKAAAADIVQIEGQAAQTGSEKAAGIAAPEEPALPDRGGGAARARSRGRRAVGGYRRTGGNRRHRFGKC